MIDEVVAQLLRVHERLVALGQRTLEVDARGHVERGQERRSVRQRQRGAIEDEPVGALDPRRPVLAMLGEIDDRRSDLVERLRVAAEGRAGARNLVDMRAVAQHGRIDFPEFREGRVEQLHASVRPERRHPFLERVEGFALHMGERGDLGSKRVALRRIVIEIGDAAFRVGAHDHAQRAPVGQMPYGLARVDRLIGAQLLRLPGAEVHLLGQLTLGAQPVEDFAVGRPLIEVGRIERPDLKVGCVVERQPLGLVEDRNRRRQTIDHPRIIVLVALHIGLERHDLGSVASEAGRADRGARLDSVVSSTPAADHRRGAAHPGAGFLDRRRNFPARRRIEHFAPSLDRGLDVGRVDREGVRNVAPDDPAHGVARPCGHVGGFERAAQALESALGVSEFVAQLRQLKALARNVADAHHGGAGHRPTVDLQMAAAQADDRGGERFATAEEPLRRLLDLGRLRRTEP